MLRLLYIFLIILLTCCHTQKVNGPPKDLSEAINYFDKKWDNQEKVEFIKDSLKNSYFTIGRWIRNNWIYGGRDSILVEYFKKLGIFHPDDMSGIILTSLYRTLTNKPIDLDNQVESYKSYWRPIQECEKNARKLAWDKFQKLKIGNQVSIYLEIDTSEGENITVCHICPDPEWNFNKRKDLKMDCQIIDKYHINDSTNVFIKVIINKMNKRNVSGIIVADKPGDTVNLSMEYLKLEIKN